MGKERHDFTLDVREIHRPDTSYSLEVKWWTTVRDLKEYLSMQTGEHINGHHLFFESGTELNGESTLHDLGIRKAGVSFSLLLDTQVKEQRESDSGFIQPFNSIHLDEKTEAMVAFVKEGFDASQLPTKPEDDEGGTAGVYFMKRGDGKRVAVFKPHDEEQGMPNNPNNRTGDGEYGAAMRDNFKPGYGCIREWATYVMDVGNFAGVPPTLLVNCEHKVFAHAQVRRGRSAVSDMDMDMVPKFGSLQTFIQDAEGSDEYSWSLYSDLTVQKSALLDLRTLNCDRNSENLLVRGGPRDGEKLSAAELKTRLELVPIDHGYALPSVLRICHLDWTWMNHPQVRAPLCPEIKAYLAELNFEEVATLVRPHLPEECIYLLQAAHWLVSKAADVELTMWDMANLVARDDMDADRPSKLEEALHTATENTYRAMEIRGGRRLPGVKAWGGEGVMSSGRDNDHQHVSNSVPAPEVVQERMQRSRRGSNSPLDAYGLGGDTRLRRHNSQAMHMSPGDWKVLGFSPSNGLRGSPTVAGSPMLARTFSHVAASTPSALGVLVAGKESSDSAASSGTEFESEDSGPRDDDGGTHALSNTSPLSRGRVGGGGLARMSAVTGYDQHATSSTSDGDGGVDVDHDLEGGGSAVGLQLSPANSPRLGTASRKSTTPKRGTSRPVGPGTPPRVVLGRVDTAATTTSSSSSSSSGGSGSGSSSQKFHFPWAHSMATISAPTSPAGVMPRPGCVGGNSDKHTTSTSTSDNNDRNSSSSMNRYSGTGAGVGVSVKDTSQTNLERFVVLLRQKSLPDRLKGQGGSPRSCRSNILTRIPSAESFFSEPLEQVAEDEDDCCRESDKTLPVPPSAVRGEMPSASPGIGTESSPRDVTAAVSSSDNLHIFDSTMSPPAWKGMQQRKQRSGDGDCDCDELEAQESATTTESSAASAATDSDAVSLDAITVDSTGSRGWAGSTASPSLVRSTGRASPVAGLSGTLAHMDMSKLDAAIAGTGTGRVAFSNDAASPRHLRAVKLSRVVSFNGFDAAPFEDDGKSSRMERRREISLTDDFKALRLRNTEEAIRLLVIKAARVAMQQGRRSI
jgi:hypothetical protein